MPLVLGTGTQAGMGANSHCLLNVCAEPYGGGTFTDRSASALAVTNTSVAQSNTQVKFGSQSMYFDAITDSLSVPDAAAWAFPRDFTIGVWIYHASTVGGSRRIFNQYSGTLNRALRCYVAAATNIATFEAYDAADATIISLVTGSAVPLNQWAHHRIVRAGSTARYYINGLVVATDGTASGTLQDSSTTQDLGGVALSQIGYRDAWMITSGFFPWARNHGAPNRRF